MVLNKFNPLGPVAKSLKTFRFAFVYSSPVFIEPEYANLKFESGILKNGLPGFSCLNGGNNSADGTTFPTRPSNLSSMGPNEPILCHYYHKAHERKFFF